MGLFCRIKSYFDGSNYLREKPGLCKAFQPSSMAIDYDLEKEFGLKIPYVVTVKNSVLPIVKDEPHFNIFSAKTVIVMVKEKSIGYRRYA
ncbi:hypothetical protein [Acetomicrobium mobile]|uniref:hypothetical protein n=1 Tax=Acetomicrobium mobile TaxID=97477 RepID=UPI0026F15BBF|nr:hypothetical protein [Acetomicrobium mobile]